MPNIIEDYQQHYSDMPFEDYAQKVHSKFYSDMPFEQFAIKAGIWKQEQNAGRGTRDQRETMNERDMDIASRVGQLRQHVSDGNIALQSGVPFSDELSSAVGAPRGLFNGNGVGEEYQRQMEAEAEARRQVDEKMPKTAMALRLAGGGALLGPAGGLGGAAANAVARPVATSLLRQVGTGLGTGAVIGGVQGVSEGQGMDRLTNAATGAALGLAVGAGAPVVARVAGLGLGVADNALSPYLRPQQFAAKKVAQRIEADNMSVDQVLNRMGNRPGLNVADAAGENVRGLTRTASNVPGPGRQRIQANINARQMGQNQRVTEAVEQNLGDPATFGQAVDQTVAQQANDAAPLFRAARESSAPVDVTPVIARIDETVSPGASHLFSPADGIAPDTVSATLGRIRRQLAGPNGAQRMDIGRLHQLRMDLDGQIATAQRAGNGPMARELGQVRQVLTRQMETASPEFAQANRIFSGEARAREALENGRLYGQGRGEISAQDIRNMTPNERALFRQGVARGVKDAIDNSVDGADLVKRIYGTRAKRDALALVFENPSERRAFANTMLREARTNRTRQAVLGNSTTARQLADQGDAGLDAQVIGSALTGNFFEAVKSLLLRSKARLGGVTPEVADQIARMTINRSPAEILRVQGLLRQAGARQDIVSNIGRQSRALITGASAATLPKLSAQ